MGLKENIQAVKEEISAEEQFLEGMIKGERFFKRHKNTILALAIVLVLGAGGYALSDFLHQNNLKVSNEAHQELMKDANNQKALEILKQKNPKLYEMFTFETAIKKGDVEALKKLATSKENAILADLATYELSQLDKNVIVKSELLGGLVLLEEGYALLKENKVEEARLKFTQIEANSPFKQIAKNLEHYQGLK